MKVVIMNQTNEKLWNLILLLTELFCDCCLGLSYEYRAVDLGRGEQLSPGKSRD